jgi:hypothetical protein
MLLKLLHLLLFLHHQGVLLMVSYNFNFLFSYLTKRGKGLRGFKISTSCHLGVEFEGLFHLKMYVVLGISEYILGMVNF